MPAGARTAVFVLTLAGFGSKAGLLPLHAWLPRAHPEAPSPVSAHPPIAAVQPKIQTNDSDTRAGNMKTSTIPHRRSPCRAE